MDIFECMTTRRSVRKYLTIPVEWDKIGQIIDSARYAPSAGNLQNWKFIVVTETDKRRALAEASLQQYWMADAPIHIVVCTILERAVQFYGVRGERLYAIQNCAAAIENMLLAANALGLGACWVGAFEEEAVKRTCGIPDYARPQAIITIGYADEKPPEPLRYTIENVVFIEKYLNRITDIDAVMEWYGPRIKKTFNAGKELIGKGVEKGASAAEAASRNIFEKLKHHIGKIRKKKQSQNTTNL